jgi:hypothetical protein
VERWVHGVVGESRVLGSWLDVGGGCVLDWEFGCDDSVLLKLGCGR